MTFHSRSGRAFWSDIRFVIGLILVAASIAGVWLIVSSAGRTTPMLQATRTIVQGEAVAAADFQVVEVALGALSDDYLAPQDLRTGQIAARTLADGELVPVAALADADDSRTTTIVIESSTGIPAGVEAGTVVELWQAPLLEDGRTAGAPRILVADVSVSAVVEPEGMLAAAATTVEIVIPRDDVADVLAAITSGALLSVVPMGASS
ncbi:SAF domain-containing protein [Microbacterium sp.]|uniref:SAF domain-containing protein n=1 Tax=Microbacterium sp. TaxID=51671 RepID=UPI0039E34288